MNAPQHPVLTWCEALLWAVVAAGAMVLAYSADAAAPLVLVYLFALINLGRAAKWRQAFYPGLLAGFLVGAIELSFFWNIFTTGAIGLWLVLAFWLGLFAALTRLCLRAMPARYAAVMIPVFWCGLEYFRSELYYLKFSWVSPALAFGNAPPTLTFSTLGVYGTGFVLALIASVALCWGKSMVRSAGILGAAMAVMAVGGQLAPRESVSPAGLSLRVAGVQLEFPLEETILAYLNKAAAQNPSAELFVLSEYTLQDVPSQELMSWCRERDKYLVVGGKAPAGKDFYNTAFVISPKGEVVFQQAKAVPIQFFKDGLPAQRQEVWASPWGKIGICICYDLSYTRVTDRLIRAGAEALIVPTMDVVDWGERQHKLHGRIAPTRAAEYEVPIFRLASSGISQLADRRGEVVRSAHFPGQGEVIAGTLQLDGRGILPLDRWLAPVCVAVTGLFALWSVLQNLRGRAPRAAAGRVPAASNLPAEEIQPEKIAVS